MAEWLPLITVGASVFNAILVLIGIRMVRTVHVLINSRMTELLAATAQAAQQTGVNQERIAADARKVVQDAVDKEIREAGR